MAKAKDWRVRLIAIPESFDKPVEMGEILEMKAKKATEDASSGTIRADSTGRVEKADWKGTWDPIAAVKVVNWRDVGNREADSVGGGPETLLRPIISARVITMKESRDALMNAVLRVKGGPHRMCLLTTHVKTNAPSDIDNAATEALTKGTDRDEVIELAVINEAVRDKVPHVWP